MVKPLEIIYADNHQLVVNKPAGLLTQPSGTDQDSIEAQAKQWIKEQLQKPGNVFLEAVHRIDKPVSGLVLFARTSKALPRLQQTIREKKSHKIYLALVEGSPRQTEDVLKHYLFHGEHQAQIVPASHPEAKLAILRYKVISSNNKQSLLRIVLETGRYHQIRVQLSAIGHPIIGDVRYGSKIDFAPDAIALHHHQLQIPHPITGEMQSFEAPPPF